jgi:hypothetical protein
VVASACTAGLTGAIVVVAIVFVFGTFGKATVPQPASVPSDSWCCPDVLVIAGTNETALVSRLHASFALK